MTDKTTRLKCECCPWSGPESELVPPYYLCPQCGEVVWSHQVVQSEDKLNEGDS